MSTSSYLPTIKMANGCRVSCYSVGNIHLLPSLSNDNVLYVLGFPFNLLSISCLTCSLDYVTSFIKDFGCLHDWSSGRIIGIECESHDLYHIRTFVHVGMVMDSPSLFRA